VFARNPLKAERDDVFRSFLSKARYLVSSRKAIVSLVSKRDYYSIRRKFIWPEDEYKRTLLQRLQRIYQYPYFVETGTYEGGTAMALQRQFEHIWTIELDEMLFMRARECLNPYNNITCMNGDSKDILPGLVARLDKPAILFLDAHFSGPGTVRGDTLSPLLVELQAIRKSSSVRQEHIVVIDDISDCSAAENGVPLSRVIEQLEHINPHYKFYCDYDMLFALPFERVHREFWRKIAPPIVVR